MNVIKSKEFQFSSKYLVYVRTSSVREVLVKKRKTNLSHFWQQRNVRGKKTKTFISSKSQRFASIIFQWKLKKLPKFNVPLEIFAAMKITALSKQVSEDST